MSVDAAAAEDLDHDLFLFRDAETDADAVVSWRDDGLLAPIEPCWVKSAGDRGPVREENRFSEAIDLDAAVAEMNVVNHRFVLFENRATGAATSCTDATTGNTA
jgi:hypothetical protein